MEIRDAGINLTKSKGKEKTFVIGFFNFFLSQKWNFFVNLWKCWIWTFGGKNSKFQKRKVNKKISRAPTQRLIWNFFFLQLDKVAQIWLHFAVSHLSSPPWTLLFIKFFECIFLHLQYLHLHLHFACTCIDHWCCCIHLFFYFLNLCSLQFYFSLRFFPWIW